MRIEWQIPLTVGEIRDATRGTFDGDDTRVLTHITTDSREAGKNDLFVALDGETENGADYVAQMHAREIVSLTDRAGEGGILVSDVREALLRLAAHYAAKLPRLKHTVAVTGSVGKTTTKEMLAFLLGNRHCHKTPGNYNNEIGVPLTVFGAPSDTEILILEFGMNHAGEIRRLAEALMPDIGIITGIGTAHIGNLGSQEAIAKAKEELLYAISPASLFVPAEDPLLAVCDGRKKVSLSDASADVALLPIVETYSQTQLLLYRGGRRVCPLTLPFSGRHHLLCLGLATAAAFRLGLTDESLRLRAQSLPTSLLRPKTVCVGDITVIDDCYNASPESVEAALRTLEWYEKGRKCVLLGDMRELGTYTESLHRQIGKSLFRHGVEECYFLGTCSPYYAAGAEEGGIPTAHIHTNLDATAPEISVRQILRYRRPNDCILCKGSHALHLENVISTLIQEITQRSASE